MYKGILEQQFCAFDVLECTSYHASVPDAKLRRSLGQLGSIHRIKRFNRKSDKKNLWGRTSIKALALVLYHAHMINICHKS